MSKEWINWEIYSDAEKSVTQKHLRKEIVKHANTKAHLTANKLFLEREKKTIKTATISNMNHQRENTERCIRTAYQIVYEDRPYTDYEAPVNLQCKKWIRNAMNITFKVVMHGND